LKRYFTFEGEVLKLPTDEAYEEAFRDVLQKAVAVRTRTIGEVGAHLSGGLDSGSIVSFAAEKVAMASKRLQTYSSIPMSDKLEWVPNYYGANEQPYIADVVHKTGNISPHYLPSNERCPLEEIDYFLDVMEMPYKFFENTYWLKGIYEQAHAHGV